MPKARMREDEEFAKSRFEAYLRSRAPAETLTWRPGDEPPDYYLMLGHYEFAVEITTLTDSISTSGGLLEMEGLDAWHKNFVKEIQNEAVLSGILSGDYNIVFGFVGFDVYGNRKIVKKRILEVIALTKTDSEFALRDIDIDGRPVCTMFKVRGNPSVACVGGPMVSKWDVEADQDAFIPLQNAINTKMKKLSHVSMQKILILRSTSILSDVELYRNFLSKLINVQYFHTVFIIGNWVKATNEQYVLYSANPEWR
jgi:hypothetical protein